MDYIDLVKENFIYHYFSIAILTIMKMNLEGYYCSEYLDDYYANGLFHATEAMDFLAHKDVTVDEEIGFMKIGEVFDDHDLTLGYRKNLPGFWGRSNYDGEFHLLTDTLKQYSEGWYQRDGSYWGAMRADIQWLAISDYYRVNVERYQWDAAAIQYFIDECIRSKQLTDCYIKAYYTVVGITLENGFSGRSFTNMVRVYYDREQGNYGVDYSADFFKHASKIENFRAEDIPVVVERIKKWIKG